MPAKVSCTGLLLRPLLDSMWVKESGKGFNLGSQIESFGGFKGISLRFHTVFDLNPLQDFFDTFETIKDPI